MSQKAELVFNVSAIVPGNTVSFNMAVDGATSLTYTFTAVDYLTSPGANQFQIGPPGSEYIAAKGNLEILLQAIPGFLSHYLLVGGGATPYSIAIRAITYNNIYNFGTFTGSSGILFESKLDNSVTAIDVSHVKTNNLCHGVSSGTITLTITGGADPFTFLWSDGGTTQNRTGLPAGTYAVQITDSLGTITNYTGIEITEPANAIDVDYTVGNCTCNGADNGFINIDPTGGTPGYSYQWDDGPATKNRSLLPPGTYAVIVTDSVGCNNTFTYVVTEPSPIAVVVTVEGNNVDLAVSGGTSPYLFEWSDGSTDQNRTGLPPGDYEVKITDANGCIAWVYPSIAQYKFFFSDNPIILALEAIDPDTKPNLSFICKVFVELEYLSDVFTEVLVMEQPADSEGKTVFDAQIALAAYVTPTLPEVGQATVSMAGNNFKRFYLRYTEKYGTPPEESTYTQVDMNYVVLGGLTEVEYAANTFFDSYQDTQKPFFTWSPAIKNVFKEQPEYLYFMVNAFDLTSFKAKVRLFYTDGTSETFTFHTQSDILKYELYIIPAGYDLLELADLAAGTVKAYEVFITDADNIIISELKRFKLITDYFPVKRFLMFLNSVGGFDTLSATGKGKMTIDTDEVVADKILAHDHSVSEPDFEIISKVGSPSIKVSTGYIGKDYADRLQDFVLSTLYYLLKDERYIPVNVSSRNAEIFDEDDTLKNIEFTIELPKVSKYTPHL